jgi:hypothetical protein
VIHHVKENAMSERTTSASWAMGIVKALEMDGLPGSVQAAGARLRRPG